MSELIPRGAMNNRPNMKLGLVSVSIVVVLLISSCALRKPAPPRESFEEIAQKAEGPARSASMRLIEEGRTELRQSRFERAANRFSKAIEIDASNPFAYFYLGVARYRVSRYSQAVELFGRASDLFRETPSWQAEALAYRGESFEKLSKHTSAIKNFEEALTVDAQNERAREGISRVQPGGSDA